MSERLSEKAVLWAAEALLCFSVLNAVSLVALFYMSHARGEDPWSWRAVIGVFSVMFGLTTGALVWRAPSREHIFAGIGVMAFSMLRVGMPDSWTSASYAILALTMLLLIPLVWAVYSLMRNDA